MLLFKIKDRNVALLAFKEGETYSVVSSDIEGHEGLLAENLNTLQELEKLVASVFGSKAICYGTYKGIKQLAKVFGCDEDLLV